jgi:hypothetical protein
MSSSQEEPEALDRRGNRFGIIKVISVIYILIGLGVAMASMRRAEIAGQQLEPLDAVVPVVWIVGAVGTLLRKNWGRVASYIFSVVILFGVPIGTLLGGFMIYHLTKHKDLFRKNVNDAMEVPSQS